jgi:outer membrane protein assembly factor BamA
VKARRLLTAALLLGVLAGCAHTRPEKLPGETDLKVSRVTISPREGSKGSEGDPGVNFDPLLPRLGSRPGNALYTDRHYNPFRVAEDRRRVLTYLQSMGYFDAEVDEPRVLVDEANAKVELLITFVTGARYRLADVAVRGAPPGTEATLDGRIKARPGDSYDLETMRIARYDMAADLQRAGYGHARVYVRTYLDRSAKEISVVYFADPGPATRIGQIRVDGNRKVTAEDVLSRVGLEPGQPFSLTRKEKGELDLYDTGAFAQVVIETTADVETYFGDVPDSGGVIPPERVADDGSLRPRPVAETIDLVVHVVEAPFARVRLRGTLEADPTRADATAGAELQLRNAFGSQHHLTLRGRVGYGILFGDDVDTPGGFYGDALARYTRPSALGRLGDARLSVQYRDVLYPGFHFRDLFAGPGLRVTIARGVFAEGDVGFRLGQQVDFGPFDDETRARFALADTDTYRGAEATSAFVWDARNDPVEPMRGHLLALRGVGSPGGALATQRYFLAAPEARGFVPLSDNFSVGLRASGAWVFGWDESGVPLGPRLFGGGAFGMRGVGRDRLSPRSPTGELVGGLSLAETSLELRYLPPLKQAGLVVFVDAGGAGRRANPFEQGVSVAAGIGPRLRLWYVPISVDLSQQIVREGSFGEHRFLVFARIGEAF